MNDPADSAQGILDAALTFGARAGWDAMNLHDLANGIGLTLADIHRHYRQKDDLAQALFERADRAMILGGEAEGWRALPPRERLLRAIWAWLQPLEAHRAVVAGMLRYKLQPDHPHLQAQGVLRISRTVQWLRETACLPATGWRRELEEVALSAIFVGAVARWLHDDSPDSGRTRAWLERQLKRAERVAMRLPG